jgi:polysaccharide biosynthesis transport protein
MEFRQFLVNLRAWSWYLVLGALVAATASYLVARQLPPVYESHATLLVSVPSASGGSSTSDMAASQQLLKTYTLLVTVPVVLERAADLLGSSVTAEQLGRVVTAQPVRDSQLMTISARGSDPVLVRDISSSVATAFMEQQPQWLPQGQAAVSLIQPALLPTRSSSDPPLPVLLGMAAVVGFLLTLGLALASEYLDDSIRTPEDLDRAVGLRALGSVGRLDTVAGDQGTGGIAPGAPVADAFRMLRTHLALAAADRPLSRLLVTSAVPGEGKSTTVAHLALALAQAGKRVVVVDADLRHTTVHRLFGVADRPGLVDLLQPDADAATAHGYLQRTQMPLLRILASGSPAGSPTELLDSPRLLDVLGCLEADADVVLLDGPSASAVADVLILGQAATTTLLVVAARRTPASTVRQAVDTLRQSGTCLLGAILNQPARRPVPSAPHEKLGRIQHTKPVETLVLPAVARSTLELGVDGQPVETLVLPAVARPTLELGVDGQPVHKGVTRVRPRQG